MKSVSVLLLKADFFRNMPPFESVKELREYLLEQHRDDLLLASDTTFRFGYFGEGDRKFTITSEIQATVLSLVKKVTVTMWVDPHLPKENPWDSVSEQTKKGMCPNFVIVH